MMQALAYDSVLMIDSPHSGKYCFGKTLWQTFLGCVAKVGQAVW